MLIVGELADSEQWEQVIITPLAVCSLFSSSPGGSICRKEGSLESGEASSKETYSRVLT